MCRFQDSICFCCFPKYGASPFSQPRPSKTYKIGFWMRKYASMSWKRTWVWSSSNRIHELDLGPLTTDEKNKSKTLTTRYRDSKGKVKFQGNSSLKRSQRLRFDYFTCGKLGTPEYEPIATYPNSNMCYFWDPITLRAKGDIPTSSPPRWSHWCPRFAKIPGPGCCLNRQA